MKPPIIAEKSLLAELERLVAACSSEEESGAQAHSEELRSLVPRILVPPDGGPEVPELRQHREQALDEWARAHPRPVLRPCTTCGFEVEAGTACPLCLPPLPASPSPVAAPGPREEEPPPPLPRPDRDPAGVEGPVTLELPEALDRLVRAATASGLLEALHRSLRKSPPRSDVCGECGRPLPPDDRFCGLCGRPRSAQPR